MKDYSKFFEELKNDMPFLKMAIEGFAGSGKTHLATEIAVGLHKKIGSKKPIVIYDTERAFSRVKDIFDKAGVKAVRKKSRSLTDLTSTFDACAGGYSDILIIDSLTHVWQEFQTAYLDAKSKRMNRRITKMSFPDWGYLKPEWKKKFSSRVVNEEFHIIFTGRATFEYEHEEDEETGKMTELVKSGIKMRSESEDAYEPDVLVLMSTIEDLMGKDKKIFRQATVLKDRYRIVDGLIFKDPVFKDFEFLIEKVLDGTPQPEFSKDVETPDNFDELDNKNKEWVKRRDVVLEEIENIFPALGLGTSVADKQIKIDLLQAAFKITSWTAIKEMPVEQLETALEKMTKFKSEMLEYLKQCSETGETVQKNMAYEFMDRHFESV